MKRMHIVTGGALVVLAGLAAGQLYLDRVPVPGLEDKTPPAEAPAASREPPAAAEPQGIDDVAAGFMQSLAHGSELDRSVAFESLLDELDGPDYARARLSPDAAQPLVEAAVQVVGETGSAGPESAALKERLASFIAGRTRSQASRDFVVKALKDGPQDLRLAVLRSVGAPQGVIGRPVFEQIAALARAGAVPAELAVPAMRRTSAVRAKDAIVALMKSTDSAGVVSACAVTLQDYRDPALLGVALERLDQLGLLDHPSKLPWLSAQLLQKDLETADGPGLARGLKAIRTRPALAKDELAALEKGLERPELRELAVTAVRNAVVTKTLSSDEGEKLLAGKSDEKKPEVLKAELPSSQPAVKAQ